MGLSSGEQGLNWTENLMQSTTLELPKPPPPTRRNHQQQQQQQQQSADDQRLECPRCRSTNTKFCYYNNYNKSQPRHFCKGCKRHWTKGGTLRNVPVGGGRKNKKFKPSQAAATTTSKTHMVSDQESITTRTLFQAMIPSSSNGLSERLFPGSSTFLPPQNDENGIFSLDNIILSSTTIFDHHKDGYGGTKNQETSLDQSTITTSSSIFSQPWQGLSTSGAMDMPSYWNWNDIDSLISGDLDTTWDDDAKIKF